MKIAICGSMSFGKEMIEAQQKLEEMGHTVIIPENTHAYANKTINIENKLEKMKLDVIRKYFHEIKEVDAILVLNYTKNGIENYVGGNSLIEMAFAHVLDKKIFLLNPIPHMNYSDEIESFFPIVLNGEIEEFK
jgi:predicted RNA-binding protein with PUA domain